MFTLATTSLAALALAGFAGALILAAISDVRRYLIPNRYPAIIAVAYGLYATQLPLMQGLFGLAMGALVLIVGAVLFARGLMGGGDVKLFAAASLWAGPALMSSFILATALAGAALGLLWLTPFRRLMPIAPANDEFSSSDAATGLRARLRQPIPFGAAIAIGGLDVAALLITR